MYEAAQDEAWWHTAYLLTAWCGDSNKNQTPLDFHPFKNRVAPPPSRTNEYLKMVKLLPVHMRAEAIDKLKQHGRI